MEMNGQLHATATSSHGKLLPVPYECEVWWATDLVWALWRREESVGPPGIQTTVRQEYEITVEVDEVGRNELTGVNRCRW